MTRLRWLDLLRSAAIVGMIVYHAAYDLQAYYNYPFDVTTGAWKVFQVTIASLFLVVSGISAGFWTASPHAFARGWRRSWTILSAAMTISLATAIADPDTWVRFGILHLIALSAFILPLLRRLHPSLIAGLGVLCIGLQPLDLLPSIVSVDYVPPVPWLGPVLLGFAIGIPLAQHAWNPPRPSRLWDSLALPGKYSLWIYVAHQPIILTTLYVANF